LQGAQDVFCALGTTIRKAGSQEAFRHVDLELPLRAAEQALKAGAEQFIVVSSVGADPASKNFYLRTKGEIERELARLHFKALHILRPSLLIGKRPEFRLGEAIGMKIAPVLDCSRSGRCGNIIPCRPKSPAKRWREQPNPESAEPLSMSLTPS